MPHKLGHTLGLDVHDSEPNSKLTILGQNMVVTIEPGIYFIKDLLNSSEFINMKQVEKYISMGGIRIEDTVLVNNTGCRLLSNIPIEINEIENMMSSNFN